MADTVLKLDALVKKMTDDELNQVNPKNGAIYGYGSNFKILDKRGTIEVMAQSQNLLLSNEFKLWIDHDLLVKVQKIEIPKSVGQLDAPKHYEQHLKNNLLDKKIY
ncbi:MAG: hypothetical protein HC904_16095 [Blastochloris sp.]|nr:hypothetical protein [Blastochloris sp.]